MDWLIYQNRARSTAFYPRPLRLVYPALGLCGEAAEVAIANPENISAELGDVLWYASNLASDACLELLNIMPASASLCEDFIGERKLNLCIGAGKISELVKKNARDGKSLEALPDLLTEFLSHWRDLCFYFNLSPMTVAIQNIEKLESRKSRGTLQGSGDHR
jgi:NTP pyrophosphatase (non-canonical NTP hydrolase)